MRARRLEGLRQAMSGAGVHLIAIAASDDFRYLVGFSPTADERACMLLVASARAVALMPSLNAEQVAAAAPELELIRWDDHEGPETALRAALARVSAATVDRLAVNAEMRADHLLLLQAVLPGAQTVSASEVVGGLREVKDRDELDALQRSSDVADRAMLAAFEELRSGATELQVADAVARAFGSAGSAVEFASVCGGANGAFPHHHPGARPLQPGDAVVIDLGGRLDGYASDITRMAFIGEPSERYREVHAIVEAAVVAALAASRPGAACAEVDAAARSVIERAGYGEYFVHRTGHGLGLSTHEPPWMMRGCEARLRRGMVHSVEPGIYLPGEFGLRLEEIVHVTETGCERLSSLPREVHVAER